jgi:hypothetical protein
VIDPLSAVNGSRAPTYVISTIAIASTATAIGGHRRRGAAQCAAEISTISATTVP